jgi:hypothetical protein
MSQNQFDLSVLVKQTQSSSIEYLFICVDHCGYETEILCGYKTLAGNIITTPVYKYKYPTLKQLIQTVFDVIDEMCYEFGQDNSNRKIILFMDCPSSWDAEVIQKEIEIRRVSIPEYYDIQVVGTSSSGKGRFGESNLIFVKTPKTSIDNPQYVVTITEDYEKNVGNK